VHSFDHWLCLDRLCRGHCCRAQHHSHSCSSNGKTSACVRKVVKCSFAYNRSDLDRCTVPLVALEKDDCCRCEPYVGQQLGPIWIKVSDKGESKRVADMQHDTDMVKS
jgi:hypothetical protein